MVEIGDTQRFAIVSRGARDDGNNHASAKVNANLSPFRDLPGFYCCVERKFEAVFRYPQIEENSTWKTCQKGFSEIYPS